MSSLYRALADLVVIVHACYVAFVVFGLLAVLVGSLFKWKWVHNLTFRLVHLTAILVVVLGRHVSVDDMGRGTAGAGR
jgi:hypothetical protein